MIDELIKAKRTGVNCQKCEKHFKPTSRRGIVPKFCCNACKQKAYRDTKVFEDTKTVQKPEPIKIQRTCPSCGSKNVLIGRMIKSACKDCGHRWGIGFLADRSQGVTTNSPGNNQ